LEYPKPHITFDFDGVLCDSIDTSIESYTSVREIFFDSLPQITSRHKYAEIFSGDPDTCLYKWLSSDEAIFFYEQQTKFSFENQDKLKLFDGISSLLQGIPVSKLSILTTNLNNSVRKLLAKEGCEKIIDTVPIFSKDLGISKLQMFKMLFHQLNLKPSNVFYVCDSEMDIWVCNELGVNSIAVSYGYFSFETLQKAKPTIIVDSVNMLRRKIKDILTDDSKN